MKKKVTITAIYEVEVDIPNDKLDEILADYRESIRSTANIDDVFEQAAYGFSVLHCEDFIEGIGDLRKEGIKIKELDLDFEFEVDNL